MIWTSLRLPLNLTHATAAPPPQPIRPTMCARGRPRPGLLPFVHASRVIMCGHSQRVRRSGVHPHDPGRWQWLDGGNYQPQCFSFHESGPRYKVGWFPYWQSRDRFLLLLLAWWNNKSNCGGIKLTFVSLKVAKFWLSHQWHNIDTNEMVFFSLVLLMGIIKNNQSLLEYWSCYSDPNIQQSYVFESVSKHTKCFAFLWQPTMLYCQFCGKDQED